MFFPTPTILYLFLAKFQPPPQRCIIWCNLKLVYDIITILHGWHSSTNILIIVPVLFNIVGLVTFSKFRHVYQFHAKKRSLIIHFRDVTLQNVRHHCLLLQFCGLKWDYFVYCKWIVEYQVVSVMLRCFKVC